MPAKRPKAPAGCYWRGKTLWGRALVKGEDVRWSLKTDDPRVAAKRRKADKDRIVAIDRGDASRSVNDVVQEWARHWLEPNKSRNTTKRYLCSIGQLAEFIDSRALAEIDGKLVNDIIKARRADGVTNATIKRDLVALSSVFNYAIDEGWIEENPVLPRLGRIEEKRDPIVLPAQAHIDLVIGCCPGMIADMVRGAMATGCREEELLKARRDSVDHDRRQMTIVGKGAKRRVIELEPFGGYRLVSTLPAYAGQPWLFWHGAGETYKNFASQFSAIVERVATAATEAGTDFRPFRFHDLRHWHAVQWLKDGGTIYDLQKRLGHSSVKTTEMYCEYLTPEEERAAKQQTGTKSGTSAAQGVPADTQKTLISSG